ncbi:hypothetical protein GWI33_007390 [Rhynchophorus ferrugineus]|uniref:Odorant receptor n=1 Tax=Rhynchophorus ferrugineus TaxID=354439 RepID=A0A834MKT0_RHYFE|nr:hypothetical protein GWI33_007390 [Rhynchophorus ferrugineus]
MQKKETYVDDFFQSFHPSTIWKKYKFVGIKYSILFLGLAHATLISSYIPAISAAIKHIKYNGENSTTILPKTLPYYSWMPFKYDTGYTYLLAILYQGGPMFSYAYSVVGMDSLFMNLMNCVTANVHIIQGAFYTIRERCASRLTKNKFHTTKLLESTEMAKEMDTEMEKIIKHLQTMFKCCHELESMYSIVTLCQVTATLFILCTCLYLVSMATPFSKQFFAECVYMAAMFFQLYLYCSFGNEVTLKEIPFYLWSSSWLATTTSFKKRMIFTMMRAKKPVYFTVGKFTPLTLSTFVSIIKTSYSIFALIKNTSL